MIAEQVKKGTCRRAWQSEFDPQNPHGRGRDPIPTSCPLTPTHVIRKEGSVSKEQWGRAH